MRRRGIAALAVALAAAGCSGPIDTPGPSPIDTPETVNRFAVRVASIDLTTPTLRYADAKIFFDEAADQAAKEDGHPDGAPNPVWIRDLHSTGALPIAPDASVALNGWDDAGNRVPMAATVDILVRVFTAAAPVPGWDNSPYLFVVVEDGRITAIEQPMLP